MKPRPVVPVFSALQAFMFEGLRPSISPRALSPRGLRHVRALAPACAALVLSCAAAKEQPRQAAVAEAPDPMTDSSAGSSSGSSSSSGRSGSDGPLAPPPSGKFATGKGGEPPHVASLASFAEGLKWGASHAEVGTYVNGVLERDYSEKLTKARVGPEQTAIEAEREQAKLAFKRTFIEFKETPTGFDTTGIRGEYTYKNKEALMWIQREGKKRYFFFFNDRLWKLYDEVPLADDGPYGKAYLDAVNKLNAQLNAQGRVRSADPAKGTNATTVDWKDGTNHLRAVDRSNERLVAIVLEESSTLANLPALRPNKLPDPNEIDPSVLAVTQGNRSDPNAAPSASASGKKAGTPPKKK